ncbi:MAG: phosphate ABC transporter substrate-binding protein [Candidatus Hadarchaeales archaeon]
MKVTTVVVASVALGIVLVTVFLVGIRTNEVGENGSNIQPRSINIAGSTTVLPITQLAAERWMNAHPYDTINVSGGGSGVGITSLIEGRCDIATSSRRAKNIENERAGGRLVEHKIALDALAVIVHPSNPVNSLTLEQIKKIYTGEIRNWSEVGGPNLTIAVYTRETTSGTYESFHELVMRGENMSSSVLTTMSSGEMRQIVSTNPNAIGYVGISYISGVKALAVNGVLPTKQNILNGTYPISRALYMYTIGEPSGLAKEFIEFVKGPEGQRIVEEKGFVSLT